MKLESSECIQRFVHFTELPKKTPVGFRGPMILWKELSKLPKIYFSEK